MSKNPNDPLRWTWREGAFAAGMGAIVLTIAFIFGDRARPPSNNTATLPPEITNRIACLQAQEQVRQQTPSTELGCP